MEEKGPWFEHLFLNNPIPQFIYHAENLRILQVNNASLSHYGYSETEFHQLTIHDLRPDKLNVDLEGITNSLQENGLFVEETQHLTKNGTRIWAQVTVQPISYKGIKSCLAQALDITQAVEKRMENEAKLRQSKATLRAVFDSAIEGFVITDKELVIQAFNRVAGNYIFSNTRHQEMAVGNSLLDYVSIERQAFFKGAIPRVMAGENFEYRTADQSDGSRWINYSLNPIKNSIGEIVGICIVGKDITAQINFEEQLKNSEQRYKALVKEGSDLINIIDYEGNYLFITPAVKSNLDPRSLGANAFQYVHEDDQEKLRQELDLLRSVKRIKSSPYRFKIGDGRYLWLETIGTNLMDEPAVNGIVINSHDVTDTINQINAIQERNTRLEEIAWIQSHLVRAPLASILGIIEILKTSEKDFQEFIPYLEQSARQLDSVIEEITNKTNDLSS